ncbi:30S ribosomal protein S12 methylthiotransferase RimO [Clostridium sp. JN-1]|uniref:30S ribosomal protein S12 methylthiotransferase RimO n=1 Tax=Clostridium sp. JN-1 TaxID=2483110 RepID=UPI000F0B06DF|nr:30S ribosomal protein S12 methylthiotransferase RimO [Clostridium sp. JN-1]
MKNNVKIGLISLGCDKNRIDSEIILSNIKIEYIIVDDPREADVIIVNTCGFIENSKQESIDTILEMAEYKKKYKCKLLAATGCLTQRYGKELMDLIPEIDILLGVNDYDKLSGAIESCMNGNQNKFYSCTYSDVNINEGNRVLTTDSHYAYIRIAEGCDNFCTYCIIPKIRGKYRSRHMENILREASDLASLGVRELILIAQDTSIYGIDIYGKSMLHELIKKLSLIDGIEWIRILYCYPEQITQELIDEMARNSKVCKYLDIPIQHISDHVLKAMGRKGTRQDIISNIHKLRQKIKNIVLRTSIIVGFPGETQDDFDELKEFIKDIKFDKLGVFKYSREEGTPAALMNSQITEEIKESREEELMSIQQQISKDINSEKVGKVYDVIVEGKDEEWYGRSYEMTPEVDGLIYFKCDKDLKIGEIVKVKITHAFEYDLIGVVYYESC